MDEFYQSKASDSTLSDVWAGLLAAMLTTAPGMVHFASIGNLELTGGVSSEMEYITMADYPTSESVVLESSESQVLEVVDADHDLQVISNFADYLLNNSSPPDPEGQSVLNDNFADLI